MPENEMKDHRTDYIKEKSISETKQGLPAIVREASAGYETITRNFKSSREVKVSIISTDLFEGILDQGFKYNPLIEKDEENQGFTISLPELMIHGDGISIIDALEDLAINLMDYTADYLTRPDFFRQIANRRGHYPYLRRISKYDTPQKVMEVIAECHTDLQQAISKQ